MAIITLTTDMGSAGYYAGIVKAAIVSQLPTATIIDITHDIQPFHVSAAAFIISRTYKSFPKGTVHIVSVDSLNKTTSTFIVVQAEGYYFIGADNGLFSLALNDKIERVIEITLANKNAGQVFPARDIFAPIAVYLAQGGELDKIGMDYPNYMRPTAWQPMYDANSITTTVLYVDTYGNCICNLQKGLFDQVGQGREMLINIKGYEIDSISQSYNEKGSGEIIALFSGTGLLELAQNHGNISQILSLKEGDRVKINFVG
jgi:S-adenosylmethionine hydrolase